MISPGIDVSGSSLPSTEHSISRPWAEASTITRGSWRAAVSTAESRALRSSIRVMPTLEPIREGFTQSGVPSSAQRSRQPSSPTATKSTCGISCPASRRFSVSLSMQVAEERTSEPT